MNVWVSLYNLLKLNTQTSLLDDDYERIHPSVTQQPKKTKKKSPAINYKSTCEQMKKSMLTNGETSEMFVYKSDDVSADKSANCQASPKI